MLRLDMFGQVLSSDSMMRTLITREGDAVVFNSDMILQDSIGGCMIVALITVISDTLVFNLDVSVESRVG